MIDFRPQLRAIELYYYRTRLSYFFALLMSSKARHLYERAIRDVGPLKDGAAIADIGCGHGTFLCMYLARYPKVHGFGLDQSSKLLDFARDQFLKEGVKAELALGDAHDYMLPPETFDVIVSCSAICYWSDPVRVIDRMYTALKPGGKLLIYDELPPQSLRLIWKALMEQKLYGFGLPAYSERELKSFVENSLFGEVLMTVDHMIVRMDLLKPATARCNADEVGNAVE